VSDVDKSAYEGSKLIKTENDMIEKLLNFPLGYNNMHTPELKSTIKEKRA